VLYKGVDVVDKITYIPHDSLMLPSELQSDTPSQQIEPIVEDEALFEEEVVYYDVPLSHELQDYIKELCDEYDVPMDLVIAIIEQESTFRSSVISESNDYGLMQINVINHDHMAKELGITDFLDPFQNVLCGIHMISDHLADTDGNIELALMMYNRGEAGAKKLWDRGIYSISYSRSILEKYESYRTRQTMEVRNNV
jgi:soluble lytic murein transglycosylase-like protein